MYFRVQLGKNLSLNQDVNLVLNELRKHPRRAELINFGKLQQTLYGLRLTLLSGNELSLVRMGRII